ncbi:MAG: hypothetical protein VXZ53_07475, partial [Planctomycetota bacterium]|nr:hypothetical protein [Planctomycetota bacterium]
TPKRGFFLRQIETHLVIDCARSTPERRVLRDAANFLVELTRDFKPIVFVKSIVGDKCREPIADRIEVFADAVAKWAAGETIRKVKTDERSLAFSQMARKSFVQTLGSFTSGGDVDRLIQYKIVFLTMRQNFV